MLASLILPFITEKVKNVEAVAQSFIKVSLRIKNHIAKNVLESSRVVQMARDLASSFGLK